MSRERREKNIGRLMLLAVALIWGCSYVVVKDGFNELPPGLMQAWRYTVAFLVLTPFMPRRMKGLDRRALLRGLLVGLASCYAALIQNVGLQYTTASNSSFLISGYVMLVPFMYWIISGKRPSGWDFLAAVICVAGIGLITLNGALHISRGDTLTLVSCLCYSLQIVLIGTLCRRDNALQLTYLMTFAAAVGSWAYSLIAEGMPVAVTFEGWKTILFLAIFVTIAAFFMQSWGQSRVPPAEATLLMALESVFGTAAGILFMNDPVTLRLMAGFAVVFAAVLISGLHSGTMEE